ncbi:MAG: dihydroorotase [bacterium]|nr:dihydroorotase [bacterium]
MANQSQITIKKPFDSHVHLRRGATLRAVTKYTAERFGRGIVMPNTDPPIDTVEQAAEYKKEILAAVSSSSGHSNILQNVRMSHNEESFEPLMTFYLTKKLTPKDIEKGAQGDVCKIYAVKSYPYGATTNSQWGYRNILEAKEVLREMENVGMPLLLHGEVHLNAHDEEEDPYDGEKMFVKDVLPRLLDTYPKLKVSLEHMSSAEAIDFMEKNGKEGQLVTTVTPHHLVYDRRQAFSGGYRALLHCKPLVKTAHDKERLLAMVKKGLPFVSAGTDTAPHPEAKKFSSCCAFGVFNAPVAVELYTQVFDEIGCLDKLEGFLSVNGPRFFGLEPDTDTITLVKEDWQVTEPVVTEEGVKIWPLCHKEHGLGNEVIHWKIQS